jgi:hypothetical protein
LLEGIACHCSFIEAFELHGHDDRMMIICAHGVLHNLVLFSGYLSLSLSLSLSLGVVWIESKLSMLLVIQSMVVEERGNASHITSNLHAFV